MAIDDYDSDPGSVYADSTHKHGKINQIDLNDWLDLE